MSGRPTSDTGISSAWRLLLQPGVRSLMMASAAGRAPVSMASLALLLTLSGRGSVATATTVAAGFGVGFAITAQVKGRLTDRYGPTRVVAVGAVLASPALALVVLPGLPSVLRIGLAAAAGLALPPVGAATRAVLTHRYEATPAARVAYRLDSVASELSIVGGGAIVSLLASATSGGLAVLCTAGLTLIGGLGFAVTRGCRSWRPAPGRQSRGLGPLAVPSVQFLTLNMTLVSASLGALMVVLVALAHALGVPAAGGWLVTATSVGSVLGSVLIAVRSDTAHVDTIRSVARRLVIMLVIFAGALVPLIFLRLIPALAALLVGAFLLAAPVYVAHSEILSRAVPPETVSEAFSLTPTTNWVGQAIGTAVAGAISSHLPQMATLAAPALFLFASAAAAVPLISHRSACDEMGRRRVRGDC